MPSTWSIRFPTTAAKDLFGELAVVHLVFGPITCLMLKVWRLNFSLESDVIREMRFAKIGFDFDYFFSVSVGRCPGCSVLWVDA